MDPVLVRARLPCPNTVAQWRAASENAAHHFGCRQETNSANPKDEVLLAPAYICRGVVFNRTQIFNWLSVPHFCAGPAATDGRIAWELDRWLASAPRGCLKATGLTGKTSAPRR